MPFCDYFLSLYTIYFMVRAIFCMNRCILSFDRLLFLSELWERNMILTMNDLQKKLFTLQDINYRDFHSRLMPTIDKDRVIGIRVPVLRKFAKTFGKTDAAASFLLDLPHTYYEENNLHMMLISAIRDYETCLAEINRFLPYIDNWTTCDFPAPKCFATHKTELLPSIRQWISSSAPYTIRYGIGMLMRLYLDEDFSPEYLSLVCQIRSEEYYVNMMIAWYLATALAKQWDATIPYLQNRTLPEWIHKKTIQKAVESYRITAEQKGYLRGLRGK